MTSNQLTLGRLREDIRHNKASENLGYATLGETKRHNVQSEQIGFGNIGLGYSQLGEAKRHNIATEDYQGEQARATAQKAASDSAYTQLQIQYYLDELKVRQDNAEANLRNAASNEQRAEIEQELADIKQEMVFWEKLRIGAEAFKDVTTGADKLVDTVDGVKGLLVPPKSK
nr:MAG: hypothetical protein [Picobirnavirus sp.]